MKNEILYRGFESIPSRRGRGGTYSYVRWQEVADRMNEAFDVWSSEVMSQEVVGENVIVRVRVSVLDSATGKMMWQEGFGGAPNDVNAEAGNPYKAAYSKALKDACKKWGLGLYLEEEGDEGGHPVPSAPPQGMQGPEYGNPQSREPQLAPEARHLAEPTTGGLPTPPSVNMGATPQSRTVQESVVVQQAPPEPVQVQEQAPAAPTPPAQNIPVPPAPQAPTTATEQIPPPVQEMAKPSQGLPTPPQVSLSKEMPMSKTTPISTGEPSRISDVQKAALHGILSSKKVSYQDLVEEAFEANGIVKNPIPEADDLTYEEAVCVVKYGNDKFRRR